MKNSIVILLIVLALTISGVYAQGGVLRGKIVVLDPGHGGIDTGAIGPTGLLEKEVNLEVALNLEKLLKAEGATVYMTRKKDEYVYLEDRIDLANEKHANLFLCIHHDSLQEYPEFDETETFYWNEEDTSKTAAECLAKTVGEIMNLEWKVKKNDFKVLKLAKVPAVLVESSFISCTKREKWLKDPFNIWKEALALDYGIISYFETMEVKR